MCKRYSERLSTTLVALVAALLTSLSAFAQGSDGRSEFSISNSTRSRPKIAKVSYRKPQKPGPPKPGALVITVNEPASNIYLTRTDDLSVPASILSNSNGSIVQSLDAGSYNLHIKKNGFFDELRNVDLVPGETKRVNVSLRPQMSLLTVKTNLGDAEIDVENAGKFNKPLKKHLVIPGLYRIALSRRGYVSQTITADLSIAGQERSIYVVLEPLRIESVLWTATKAIERRDLDAATDLVNDVLALNPKHAKANLVRGVIELHRGSETAISYFLKAIDGGETVLLPMRVQHFDLLVEIDLSIDREAISFATENYLDLNFRVLRSELDELSRTSSPDQAPFLTVRGKSNFFGKTIRPEMRIYSRTPGQAECTSGSACLNEIELLYRFISKWRLHAGT